MPKVNLRQPITVKISIKTQWSHFPLRLQSSFLKPSMSTANKPRQWGVTAPISVAASTQHELQLTETLVQALKNFNLFESDQEARKR